MCQFHFIREHATADRMCVMKSVTEKTFEFGIRFNSFTDCKQASDMADINCQYRILREFKIHKKQIILVRMALVDSNCKVKFKDNCEKCLMWTRGPDTKFHLTFLWRKQ
jgi:hypothetical protein